MTAYELYKALEQKFEEDPTAKDLPVCVNDGEWGEMDAKILEFRPKSIVDNKQRNIVLLDW